MEVDSDQSELSEARDSGVPVLVVSTELDEVVALADTASYPIDPATHVERVVRICRQHANALIEIANEPYHPTQDARVHDEATLDRRIDADRPTGEGGSRQVEPALDERADVEVLGHRAAVVGPSQGIERGREPRQLIDLLPQ